MEKWLALGFCAWLAWPGEHSFRNASRDRALGEDFEESYHFHRAYSSFFRAQFSADFAALPPPLDSPPRGKRC